MVQVFLPRKSRYPVRFPDSVRSLSLSRSPAKNMSTYAYQPSYFHPNILSLWNNHLSFLNILLVDRYRWPGPKVPTYALILSNKRLNKQKALVITTITTIAIHILYYIFIFFSLMNTGSTIQRVRACTQGFCSYPTLHKLLVLQTGTQTSPNHHRGYLLLLRILSLTCHY